MCVLSHCSVASPVRVNPQENLKEIRKYLKKIPCLCVCIYAYLHMCGHTCELVCVCGDQRQTVGIFLVCFLFYWCRLSPNSEFTSLVSLASLFVPGISAS